MVFIATKNVIYQDLPKILTYQALSDSYVGNYFAGILSL